MINSRSLDDLHPYVKTLAEKLTYACARAEIDLLITSTYRDAESQFILYQQGRSTPGAIVTNARPGESFHNYRVAFDFVPIENGKCAWNDIASFQKVGVLAEGLGMEWAGRWTGPFKELAHVQWTGGLSITDLQNGKTPPVPA